MAEPPAAAINLYRQSSAETAAEIEVRAISALPVLQ